jgi:CBS domain-containing protein
LRAFVARIRPSLARARAWMTAEPVVVGADTPIEAAEALMTEYAIHQVAVVEGGRPVGILGLRPVRASSDRPRVRLES